MSSAITVTKGLVSLVGMMDPQLFAGIKNQASFIALLFELDVRATTIEKSIIEMRDRKKLDLPVGKLYSKAIRQIRELNKLVIDGLSDESDKVVSVLKNYTQRRLSNLLS